MSSDTNKTERPRPVEVRISGIPAALKGKEFDTRWIAWRYVLRENTSDWTKVPIHPVTLRSVDATRVENGVEFERALRALRAHPKKLDGLGFILGQGIAGIDVDDCIADDTLDARGRRISDKFEETYAEISPSGTGFKVLMRVDPELRVHGKKHKGVEVYSERRYFCITGQRLNGHAGRVALLTEPFLAFAKSHGANAQQTRAGDSEVARLDEQRPGTPEDLRKLRRALRVLPSDDYEVWQKYAAAMRKAFRHSERLEKRALDLFTWWSSKSAKYNGPDDCGKKWNESDTSDGNQPCTIATILYDAQQLESQNNETRGVGKRYTMGDLDDWGDLPEVQTYIQGLLTQGLYILISTPKMGKTFLVLQLAHLLSNALKVWDREVPRKLKVAALLLEEGDEFNPDDEPGRMHPQDRIKRRLRDMGFRPSQLKNITFVYEIPPLPDGGLEFIEKIVNEHDFVFIDSMAMLRATAEERRELGIWNRDYEFVKPLQRIASRLGKGIMMLAHAGKGSDVRDAMDAIAGTQGLQAGADAIWVMQRPDHSDRDRVRLHSTGRDVPTATLELRWNGEQRHWDCVGEWLVLSPRMREVLDLLLSEPYARRRGFTYVGIAQTIGCSEANARLYCAGLTKYKLVEVIPERGSSNRPADRAQRGRPASLVRATDLAYTRAGRGNEVEALQRIAEELM